MLCINAIILRDWITRLVFIYLSTISLLTMKQRNAETSPQNRNLLNNQPNNYINNHLLL